MGVLKKLKKSIEDPGNEAPIIFVPKDMSPDDIIRANPIVVTDAKMYLALKGPVNQAIKNQTHKISRIIIP